MRMTIGKKLFGGFAAVLILLCILAGVSNYQISVVDHTYSNLINDRAKKLILTKRNDAANESTGQRYSWLSAIE